MLAPITRINFDDYTELIPAFTVVILMSFTYNIGIGITGDFYPLPFLQRCLGPTSRSSTRPVGAAFTLFRFLSILPVRLGRRRRLWKILIGL